MLFRPTALASAVRHRPFGGRRRRRHCDTHGSGGAGRPRRPKI